MKQFTSFDGITIAYREWGADTTRPPVVLHHGFVADAETNWVMPGVVDALVAAGRRVVALDARGHGASGKPHHPSYYGDEAMARDLGRLLDIIGADPVHLAGYSMGAVVSLVTAARDARVTRLVVGGIGASVVELGGVDTRAVPRQVIAAALLAEDPGDITDPRAMQFRRLAEYVGADREALAAHTAARRTRTIPLRDIRADTLVIAGDGDPLAARPEVLAGAIPRARLITIPGDHMSAVMNPGFTTSIVDFLAEPD